ncbi:helix-turn-helix domain-containing protein [Elizabethkingia ursingii]|uniref:helix-turn-helix domain-containing protein n=1 Tax=Elizabethkingia ursingii TaxID=1756150 RepID=UPI0020139406|nr:AraC family transcriptional regulator [Elizabethkingia ursingii]MCL1672597.1 AraC family transcriptional regulator [Elizabethkingia ursingii]
MKYKEIIPDGFLTSFIHSFWEYETGGADFEHTIIPDGYFDLIAKFEQGILTSINLTGIWTKPVDVKIPKSTKIFAIRFKLIASEYLFQYEIKTILNTTKELPLTFWNIHTYRSDNFEKFVCEIFGRLESSITYLKEIDNRKLKLFELAYSKKNLSVSELSENVFWSSRQINRYFSQQFGFSLKEFLNIIRCNASYKDIAKGNLYPDDNFFDQSHFIKEIKKHTGATPGELSRNHNARFIQLITTS